MLKVNMRSGKCVTIGLFPTIAATAGDQDVRRRGLSWAWAEGVQTVERVLTAVAWRGEGVAALGVPAVDVATVPDAAFRALCLLRLLNIHETHAQVTSNAEISVKYVHTKGKIHNILCKVKIPNLSCVLTFIWRMCSPPVPDNLLTLSAFSHVFFC